MYPSSSQCPCYVKLRQLLTTSALNELTPDLKFLHSEGSDEKRFKCDACPKSYKYKEGLYTHKRFACGKDPQFKCPYCTYRAYHKGNLKIHVVKNHPECCVPNPNRTNEEHHISYQHDPIESFLQFSFKHE